MTLKDGPEQQERDHMFAIAMKKKDEELALSEKERRLYPKLSPMCMGGLGGQSSRSGCMRMML